MINTLLVDDEKKSIIFLTEVLKTYCPKIRICGCATTISEAELKIKEFTPQLIFLEVEMQDGNCFDLLDRANIINTEIVFVTACKNSILKALRHDALDYITKPINIPELIAAVLRASERIAKTNSHNELELLHANIETSTSIFRIALPYKDGYIFVPNFEIERMEAKGSYTEIWLHNGDCYLACKNIKEYEEILPEQLFCRIHHSHIVNLDCVKIYHRGRGGYIEMSSGKNIEVSVRRKDAFLRKFR